MKKLYNPNSYIFRLAPLLKSTSYNISLTWLWCSWHWFKFAHFFFLPS